jgi:hypothetical protein
MAARVLQGWPVGVAKSLRRTARVASVVDGRGYLTIVVSFFGAPGAVLVNRSAEITI